MKIDSLTLCRIGSYFECHAVASSELKFGIFKKEFVAKYLRIQSKDDVKSVMRNSVFFNLTLPSSAALFSASYCFIFPLERNKPD